ncbi:hypothetical protein CHF27_004310 [Romboutsia maritimum]|uniref:Uncharacterized protein n=1 Tax=Romboutsia maritimum TaxID=2020948 RepID=A0A371IV06_9FIRM|nr:hypothetical protein [Romboutsia maritimum]RDY24313.1 hypothetical protein CHF27_004310 [Romboutsia maritimum]
MYKLDKYNAFIEKLIDDSPKYMVFDDNKEKYLLFDTFVMSLSDKAMPWLFKVYLDKNLNILKEDKFTFEVKKKYEKYNLNIVNINGNVFFNKDSLCVILIELNLDNQLLYNDENNKFNLK